MSNTQKQFVVASSIVMVLCAGVCALYAYTFNGGISRNQADWGTFGDFVGGICSLLLMAMNIWIFYKLTIAISHQETAIAKSQLHFEAIKFKLQKQEELITRFREAKRKAFTNVDIDNCIASINIESFEDAYGTIEELSHFGLWLNAFESKEYENARRSLRSIFSMLHNGSEADDFMTEEWEERVFGIYFKFDKVEQMLKAENRETLNEVLN